MGRSRILTRDQIYDFIADGQIIVISKQRVLRLDSWLEKHPGGKLTIMHMVGRDATDEMNAYHSAKALAAMAAFQIGRIEGIWVNFVPPIRGGAFVRQEEKNPLKLVVEEALSDSRDTGCEADTSSCDLKKDTHCTRSRSPNLSNNTPIYDSVLLEKSNASTLAIPSTLIASPPSVTLPLNPTLYTRTVYTDIVVQHEIDRDLKAYPSIDIATQREITLRYQELHRQVKEGGHYNCRYMEYAKECARYSIFFSLFLVSIRHEWYLTSAAFLGLFWHQIMFTAHDAGHMGITHNFKIDTLIGIFVADFCCGLSIGWWKSSHNVHHLITNHPEHDPDIQNVPLFATSPSFFKSIHSTYYNFQFVWDRFADLAVQFQHYTYYPIMCIARFNLYLLSWLFLLSNKAPRLGAASWTRPTELLFMAGYWYVFGYCLLWKSIPTWFLRVGFVLISHMITMPLHVQITLSHWAMSTADLGEIESFAQKQLRTTMDVQCPAWLDFIHGGLQFQAVHHLFPRVPRHNLRRVQTLVREFCKDVGIEYKILGFVDGNKEVLGRLGEVGKQVELLVQCQKYMVETGESGLAH
ncbi:hypothetical protein FGG08_001804 [Glutinoglossum americanum]|uniref:Delta 8-(E)-sphingolipid desaturase n=1 Tax=Glutinoglossum americanum TaxID=1670608 RepID=A0A9P8IAJ3_9PEZI|nr:hypothetical protein FGG08_001804 [Glutinoglossum americanum]